MANDNDMQRAEELRGLVHHTLRLDEVHRKQLVHELHDDVLQRMFLIKDNAMCGRFDEQIPLIDSVISTLQRLIRNQRPPLSQQGLVSAVQELILKTEQASGNPPIILFESSVSDAELSLSEEEKVTLYRIVQEALVNALRHAKADKVVVTLTAMPTSGFEVRIKDDGVGLPASLQTEDCYGLVGMQERAAMIGAKLDIASAAGVGTTVEVCF
jgi:signal transduction histidine kinase